MDDMITKGVKEINILKDLEKTLELLRHYGMKLNLKKHTFRVKFGKFLGYMIDQIEIEANPDKIKAVLNMKSSKMAKEVENSTGCIAAFGRLI